MTTTGTELRTTQLLIGGKWVDAQNGATYVDRNPATGQPLAEVAAASRADVERAVAAARTAFDEGAWPRTPAVKRARTITKMVQLLSERLGDLAALEVADNGKPLWTAKGEMGAMLENFEFYAGAATKLYGQTIPGPSPAYINYTLKEPVGVVGAIVPWNFPLLLASWKVAPALAAGCTMVLKPAPATPLTAIELGKIALEAGLPEGVLNIVTGPGPETGQAIVESPLVDKIAFTGSTATGRWIAAEAAKTIKRVTLELGGKSPSLVFDDADLSKAIPTTLAIAFMNSGQACVAGTRLLAPKSRLDEVKRAIMEAIRAFPAGDPSDPKTAVGPMVTQKQYDRVQSYIRKGIEEGAEVLIGGEGHPEGLAGYFVKPTVFVNVKNDMSIAREEIFGPVLCVIAYDDDEDAIRIAN
ncbi:MAG: aldehyde dehydrogenase, partial [bacterium]|nr:aldehyde dehydrogenase [bacterium]